MKGLEAISAVSAEDEVRENLENQLSMLDFSERREIRTAAKLWKNRLKICDYLNLVKQSFIISRDGSILAIFWNEGLRDFIYEGRIIPCPNSQSEDFMAKLRSNCGRGIKDDFRNGRPVKYVDAQGEFFAAIGWLEEGRVAVRKLRSHEENHWAKEHYMAW